MLIVCTKELATRYSRLYQVNTEVLNIAHYVNPAEDIPNIMRKCRTHKIARCKPVKVSIGDINVFAPWELGIQALGIMNQSFAFGQVKSQVRASR